MRLLGVGLGVVVLGACGAHSGEAPPTGDGPQHAIDAPSNSIDSNTTADAWQWSTLITNDWSQASNAPTISCKTMLVQQDMWIDGFRSSAMTEENDHQFLILTPNSTCPGNNYLFGENDELLYGAGLGANEVDLPAGTAAHVTPTIMVNGTPQTAFLMLYDHLDAGTASGASSIEVHTVEQASVQHDVDLMLAGQGTINMPTEPASSTCIPAAASSYTVNVVGLWPHMHESGQHVTVSVAGTNILDTDYTYANEQTYMQSATITSQQNLSVTCTLQSSATLTYNELKPESAGGTLCWTGIYKWPTGSDPVAFNYGPEECVTNGPEQFHH
jgi:hypothetical protein